MGGALGSRIACTEYSEFALALLPEPSVVGVADSCTQVGANVAGNRRIAVCCGTATANAAVSTIPAASLGPLPGNAGSLAPSGSVRVAVSGIPGVAACGRNADRCHLSRLVHIGDLDRYRLRPGVAGRVGRPDHLLRIYCHLATAVDGLVPIMSPAISKSGDFLKVSTPRAMVEEPPRRCQIATKKYLLVPDPSQ